MTHPPAAVCGRRRSLLQAGLGAALLPLAPLAVRADAYPSRPITLVVPFPAGGSVDLIGRIYAERLAKVLGVSVIIENRDGAGGSIGSQRVARAKADGYTLVASSQSSHLANPLMHSNLGYDPIQDFSAISQLSRSLNALVVHPDVPARTLTEFVAHLKANPDQLHFGTAGVGSMGQLNAELFKSTLGVKAVHVPYRGGGPLISGLLSNQVQFMLDNLAPMLPYIQSGKLRAWRSPRPRVRPTCSTCRPSPNLVIRRSTRPRGSGWRRPPARPPTCSRRCCRPCGPSPARKNCSRRWRKTAPCRPTNRRRPSSLP